MFSFFKKKEINVDELLLDIVKEKGVLQIIQGYTTDLERIDENIKNDEVEFLNYQKDLNNLKSKVDENYFMRFHSHSSSKPNHSIDYSVSIGSNRASIRHWESRIQLFTGLSYILTNHSVVCKNKSVVRCQWDDRWQPIAKKWIDISIEFSSLVEEFQIKSQKCEEKRIVIDRVLQRQMRDRAINGGYF